MTSLFQCSMFSHNQDVTINAWNITPRGSCEWGQRPGVCVTLAISSIHQRLLTFQMVSAPPISDHNKKLQPFMFRAHFFSPVELLLPSLDLIPWQCTVLDQGPFSCSFFTTFVCGITVFVQSWSHFIDGCRQLIILGDEVPDGVVSHHQLVQLPHEPLVLLAQQLLRSGPMRGEY